MQVVDTIGSLRAALEAIPEYGVGWIRLLGGKRYALDGRQLAIRANTEVRLFSEGVAAILDARSVSRAFDAAGRVHLENIIVVDGQATVAQLPISQPANRIDKPQLKEDDDETLTGSGPSRPEAAARASVRLHAALVAAIQLPNRTQWPTGRHVELREHELGRLYDQLPADASRSELWERRVFYVRVLDFLASYQPTLQWLAREVKHHMAYTLGLLLHHQQWTENLNRGLRSQPVHRCVGHAGCPAGLERSVWPRLDAALDELEAALPALRDEYETTDLRHLYNHITPGGFSKGSYQRVNLPFHSKNTSCTGMPPRLCAALKRFESIRSEKDTAANGELDPGGDPRVVSVRFVLLHPASVFKLHTARSNQRLKVHCGIQNPGRVTLQIANLSLPWQEGHCMLLDTSYEHAIRSAADAPMRVVLEIKISHPDLHFAPELEEDDDETLTGSGPSRPEAAARASVRLHAALVAAIQLPNRTQWPTGRHVELREHELGRLYDQLPADASRSELWERRVFYVRVLDFLASYQPTLQWLAREVKHHMAYTLGLLLHHQQWTENLNRGLRSQPVHRCVGHAGCPAGLERSVWPRLDAALDELEAALPALRDEFDSRLRWRAIEDTQGLHAGRWERVDLGSVAVRGARSRSGSQGDLYSGTVRGTSSSQQTQPAAATARALAAFDAQVHLVGATENAIHHPVVRSAAYLLLQPGTRLRQHTTKHNQVCSRHLTCMGTS